MLVILAVVIAVMPLASSSPDLAAAKAGVDSGLSFGGLLAFPKSALVAFFGLPVFVRIASGLAVFAAAFIVFRRMSESSLNNLRRARSLHEKAASLHEKGREDEARLLFEKSNYYRERAEEMGKNGMV